MFNLIGRCILLIYLLVLSCGIMAIQSPCPDYFRYFWNDRFETMGQVKILSPPKYSDLHLKIELTLDVSLPSGYIGQLELARSKEESVRDIQQGRPLFYIIHFPVTQPLPILTNLWFNGQLYCRGPRALGPIVTSIVLEHTLFLPKALITSANSGNNFGRQPNFNNFISSFNQVEPPFLISKPLQLLTPTLTSIPTPLPLIPTTSIPIPLPLIPITSKPPSLPSLKPGKILLDDNYTECGQDNIQNKDSNPLIAEGVETKPGQWPWLVAIFIAKLKFEFQCTGTLITNKHIVTVAHCTRLGDLILPANTMLVSLGRFRLWDWREKGSINREIKEYKIHPDYKGDLNGQTADADLAVMTLWETVEFSKSIKPICFWTGSNDLRDIVGFKGYVIGWGKNEFGRFLNEPRLAVVPIVSQEDCLWSHADFISFTSNRTFCAGSRNGSGPCNGDSGSGLIIRRKDGRYYLRGAVSRSLLDTTTMSCDLKNYVVYVDLTKYLNWIRLQIAS